MADRRYRTIVADPPWPIRDTGARTVNTESGWKDYPTTSRVPYPTLTVTEIAALPVGDLSEPDAHLYVWTINAHVCDAYTVARAWGFKPSTLLTWCKKPMGVGFGGTFVNSTEFILFARRGTLPALRRWDRSHFDWRRGASHSQKPGGLQDVVMVTSPGPYLELFARTQRLGWDTWGNEALNHVTIPAHHSAIPSGASDPRAEGPETEASP